MSRLVIDDLKKSFYFWIGTTLIGFGWFLRKSYESNNRELLKASKDLFESSFAIFTYFTMAFCTFIATYIIYKFMKKYLITSWIQFCFFILFLSFVQHFAAQLGFWGPVSFGPDQIGAGGLVFVSFITGILTFFLDYWYSVLIVLNNTIVSFFLLPQLKRDQIGIH